LGSLFSSTSNNVLTSSIDNKGLNTIHSPKVVTRFQSCLQSLKICNVPQRNFSIFQHNHSVKPNEKGITYVAHDFFNANLHGRSLHTTQTWIKKITCYARDALSIWSDRKSYQNDNIEKLIRNFVRAHCKILKIRSKIKYE
jgi:hypothetical protein